MRVRWNAVAIWTVLVASIMVGVLAFGIHRAARDTAKLAFAPPDPNDVPMDYADPDVRRVLENYETFTLGRGLDSVASKCRESSEIYRVIHIPGLGDGDFTSVELSIAGGTANVEIRKYGPVGNGDHYAWQIVADRAVGENAQGAIRASVARLLDARLPITDGPIVDASETTAETCRRGRYHLFVRHQMGENGGPFDVFAKTMLAHASRRSTYPTQNQPSSRH